MATAVATVEQTMVTAIARMAAAVTTTRRATAATAAVATVTGLRRLVPAQNGEADHRDKHREAEQ